MKSSFARRIKIHLSEGKLQARAKLPFVCFLFVAMWLRVTCVCSMVTGNAVGIKLFSVVWVELI